MGQPIDILSPQYFIPWYFTYIVFIYIVSKSFNRKNYRIVTVFDSVTMLIYLFCKYEIISYYFLLIPVIAAIIIVALQGKGKRFNLAISGFMPIFSLLVSGCIGGLLLLVSLGDDYKTYYSGLNVHQDYLLILFLSIIETITVSLVISGIFKLIHSKKNNYANKSSKYMFFLWLPVTHLVWFLVWIYLFTIYDISISREVTMLSAIISATIFVFDITTFFVIDRVERVDLDNLEYEKQLQKNRLEYQEAVLVEENKSELRKIRHDLNNILLTAKTLITLGNTDEAVELIDKTTKNLSTVDGIPVCSNSTLNALFSLKKSQAKENGCALSFKVSEYEPLKIDPYDICRILSNMIDNAIEAVQSTENKSIEVCYKAVDGIVTVNTKNKFSPERRKKRSDKGRGNGGIIIREIVNKYNGNCTTRADGDSFFAAVDLQNKNATPPPNYRKTHKLMT